MKTHKPKSATFFLELCHLRFFRYNTVGNGISGDFSGKKGGAGGGTPPHTKKKYKKGFVQSKKMRKKGGVGGVPPPLTKKKYKKGFVQSNKWRSREMVHHGGVCVRTPDSGVYPPPPSILSVRPSVRPQMETPHISVS
jgi:hypothetical protein